MSSTPPSGQHTQYEIFLSYSRADNTPVPPSPEGWVTSLRNHILEDHRRFSTEPLRIFLDSREIRDMDDWRHRILGALRHSKILLVCLSPNYFASQYCRWEWDEYIRRQVHQLMGADSIASVYFVDVPGSAPQQNARWLESVMRGNYTDIRPWFPEGAVALQREEVRRRMEKLGQSLWERIQRSRRADGPPGNLRRQNPWFVGRAEELRRLHEHLAAGAVGLITAVHGLGGQGKTELAVAYAHGWADHYPLGLWVLAAEGAKELLPLIGELAYAPELGYRPTEAERHDPVLLGRAVLAEFSRRASALKSAEAVQSDQPDSPRSALLILDNVSDSSLLSAAQIATLPRADELRIVATTRLDAARLDPSGKNLETVAVDSLAEADALALVRDHQSPRDFRGRLLADVPGADPKDFIPRFVSATEEDAARQLVRQLGGFTLAIEQAAVYLGLHPEIAPSALLKGLLARGLASVDRLARSEDVGAQMLHREKQLAAILDDTLKLLDPPARTALSFAALLPPDTVPWPWLEALTAARHPHLVRADGGEYRDDEPLPWLAVRRRLEGLRLLTPGDAPQLARLHRLVGAHLRQFEAPGAHKREDERSEDRDERSEDRDERSEDRDERSEDRDERSEDRDERSEDRSQLVEYLAQRAWTLQKSQILTELWELDALLLAIPPLLRDASSPANRGLANASLFLSDQAIKYRSLRDTDSLLRPAHRYLQRLAASDASNAGWQRDLSVSQNKMGDVLRAQGDLAGALAAYRESLRVRERLAASDASNAGWQRDLSVSQNKIGDVLRAQGDLAGALAAYRESLRVSERLAASDASNAGWQRDLSVSQNKIGDVLSAQGDLAGALAAYRESLRVSERLAASDASNAGWQRDLSVSQEKIGDVLSAQGDLAGALAAYRESLRVRERLAASDASNAGWQRDLSVSQNKIGDVLRAQGDLAGALAAYRESLRVRERLAASDASNAGWQRDLSVSQDRIGDVLSAQGDLAGALSAYRESLRVSERLAASDASNAGWQRDLSVSQNKIGDVLRAQGDLAGALAAYRESLRVRERLAASDASNAEWQRDLSVSQDRIGDVLSAQGDLAGALAAYRESLRVSERLAASDASNAEWQRDLCVSYWKMAAAAENSASGEAADWWRKAYETLSAMKQRGIMQPVDEKYLAQLKQKVGR